MQVARRTPGASEPMTLFEGHNGIGIESAKKTVNSAFQTVQRGNVGRESTQMHANCRVAVAAEAQTREIGVESGVRWTMNTTQQAYTMLGNESLWDVAARCHGLLTAAEVPYSICGGVAVCLHGYQRNTTDLDLVIRSEDSQSVRRVLTEAGFAWDSEKAEFRTEDGIAIQFLIAGQQAGKGTEVLVSEPVGDLNVEQIEGLSVVRLSRLIELKIASGMNNLRRTHKDFADVVELIAIRHLDGSFARHLHKSLRPTFRQLVRNATTTDD